jgi:hypothetical protein
MPHSSEKRDWYRTPYTSSTTWLKSIPKTGVVLVTFPFFHKFDCPFNVSWVFRMLPKLTVMNRYDTINIICDALKLINKQLVAFSSLRLDSIIKQPT